MASLYQLEVQLVVDHAHEHINLGNYVPKRFLSMAAQITFIGRVAEHHENCLQDGEELV